MFLFFLVVVIVLTCTLESGNNNHETGWYDLIVVPAYLGSIILTLWFLGSLLISNL